MTRSKLAPVALVLVAVAGLGTFGVADEPGWTDQQRADESLAVFTGTVRSVETALELSDREVLKRAVVKVESASKAAHLVGGDALTIYYESPVSGPVGVRCPAYAALKIDQRATFYLRLRMFEGEWRAFVEMGSDVRDPADD